MKFASKLDYFWQFGGTALAISIVVVIVFVFWKTFFTFTAICLSFFFFTITTTSATEKSPNEKQTNEHRFGRKHSILFAVWAKEKSIISIILANSEFSISQNVGRFFFVQKSWRSRHLTLMVGHLILTSQIGCSLSLFRSFFSRREKTKNVWLD